MSLQPARSVPVSRGSQGQVERLDTRAGRPAGIGRFVPVRVKQDKGPDLVGEVENFLPNRRQRVTRTEISWVTASAGAVGLRRRFAVSEVFTSRTPRPAQAAPSTEEGHAELWRNALAQNDDHLVGSLDGALRGGRLQLPGIQGPRPDGSWGPWLPMVPDEEPLVGARRYDLTDVRVRVVPDGQGFRCSIRAVEPLGLPDLIERLTHSGVPDERRQKLDPGLYYVGEETLDDRIVHRFEWGPGWVVDVPQQLLVVGDRPFDPNVHTLFHGDRILAAQFVLGPDGSTERQMVVALRDIKVGVERNVVAEAEADVVHELEVVTDAVSGRVRVLRIRTGRETASDDDRRHSHRVEFRGLLDEPSQARLRDVLGGLAERGTPLRILGRLEREEASARRGRLMRFTYLPPRVETDGEPGLRPQDRLFLEAGDIQESHNDLALEFHLPQGQDWPMPEQLSVRVGRRQYSFRENTLRREYVRLNRNKTVFHGNTVMLIALSRHLGDNRWDGSALQALPRPVGVLRSLIDSRVGTCLGVLRTVVLRTKLRERRVEIRPGVQFRVDPQIQCEDNVTDAEGSLVELRVVGGRVMAALAMRAEQHYLSRDRPVTALPKNSLLRTTNPEPADARAGYTVAGFASVQARVRRESAEAFLGLEHPKLAMARSDSRNTLLRLPNRGEIRAGIVRLPGSGLQRPSVVPSPSGEPLPLDWAQLSFTDGSAAQVRESLRSGTWTYHDRNTGRRLPGGAVERLEFREPRRATNEAVFFDRAGGDWTLRYRPDQLPRYGYHAGHLVEDDRWLDRVIQVTVAGLAGNSRRPSGWWVELSPGRVAELPGRLVFADTPGGQSLAGLDLSRFSVGDVLRIRLVARAQEPARVVLVGWQPTLRAAHPDPAARLVLPVHQVDPAEGLLELGAPGCVVRYPASPDIVVALEQAPLVSLSHDNRVTAVREPAAGDVVLLGAAEGELVAPGLPRRHIELETDQGRWPGSDWLRDLLLDADRRAACSKRWAERCR